jgi:hypothetical protein
MNLILSLITIGLIIYSVRLFVLNLNHKKRAEQAIKEYKHLKDDYFELMREMRDLKNKNILLESIIKTIKSK